MSNIENQRSYEQYDNKPLTKKELKKLEKEIAEEKKKKAVEVQTGHNVLELAERRNGKNLGDVEYSQQRSKQTYLLLEDGVSRKKMIRQETKDQIKERNRHVNKAIVDLLNTTAEEDQEFKRREVRSMNWNKLPEVVYNIVSGTPGRDQFLVNDKIQISQENFPAFREMMKKSGIYEKQGILNRREYKRIAKLFNKISSEGLQKIMDLGVGRANSNFVENYNIKNLLERGAINQTNVLQFLADFDNNGLIDNKDIGSSMTGYQLLENIKLLGDREKDKDGRRNIINGPKTSNVLKGLLRGASVETRNQSVDAAVQKALAKEQLTMLDLVSLLQQSPELKVHILRHAQSLNEYTEGGKVQLMGDKGLTEKFYELGNINRELSIFNPEQKSLEYFTDADALEAIKNMEGFDMKALEKVTGKNAEVIQRSISGAVLRYMNIVVDAMFLRFGPAVRQFQYIWGDAKFGATKYLTLSDEEKRKPLSEQEKKQFLQSFKKEFYTKTKLGLSTGPSASNGKIDGRNLGVSGNIDWIKKDYSDRYGVNAGANINPFTGNMYVGLGREGAGQFNQKRAEDITGKVRGVNRLGAEAGLLGGVNYKQGSGWGFDAYAGSFIETDKIGGIEQRKMAFQSFFNNLIFMHDYGFEANQNPTYDQLKQTLLQNVRGAGNGEKFYAKYKGRVDTVINTFVDELKSGNVLEDLAKENMTPEQKNAIVRKLLDQSGDGFKALFEQAELDKLNAKGIHLTQGGLRGSLGDLIRGKILGAFFKARLSSFRSIYEEDAAKLNRISQELNQGVGMEQIDLSGAKDLQTIAQSIEHAYAIEGLTVTAKNNTLEFTAPEGKSIAQLLHVYYTPGLEKSAFHFDGNKLVVGNVGTLSFSNVLQGFGRTSYLLLGSNQMKDMREMKTTEKRKAGLPDVVGNPKVEGIENYYVTMDMVNSSIDKGFENTIDGPIAKQEIKEFFSLENGKPCLCLDLQKMQTPAPVTGLKLLSEKDGKQFYQIPGTGSLNFEKRNGKYNLAYDATKTEKLDITYSSITPETSKEIASRNKNIFDYTTNPETKQTLDILSKPVLINKLIGLDTKYPKVYAEFLAHASNVDSKDTNVRNQLNGISEKEYEAAATDLKTLFADPSVKDIVEVKQLVTILEKGNINSKALLINKMKSIFATETALAKNSVTSIIQSRKEAFKDIVGPSNEKIPESIAAYRKKFETEGKKITTKATAIPNLFGYTAFYRYPMKTATGEVKTDHRRFSLTAPGSTNALDTFHTKIEKPEDRKQAAEWFAKNFEKNELDAQIILNALQQKLSTEKIPNLSSKQLADLLKGESIVFTIDNKNKKCSIDVDYMFYLLAECANESVGVAIKNIKIEEISGGDLAYNASVETANRWNISVSGSAPKNSDLDIRGKESAITLATQISGVDATLPRAPRGRLNPGAGQVPGGKTNPGAGGDDDEPSENPDHKGDE